MAYKDPEEGRARDRERFRQRTAERLAQGVCPNCGKAPPTPDHVLCRHCVEKRRAVERARYAKAKAAGKLYGGRDPEERRRNARDRTRRRYDARREAGLCTRCGLHPPVEGHTACEPCRGTRRAARCEPCARRSCERSGHFCGLPLWPTRYTVIELASGEDHGTYDSEAEVAVCLAFARLSFDQVEVLGDVSPMQRFTAWS